MKLQLTRHRGYGVGLLHPEATQQMAPGLVASTPGAQDTSAAKALVPASMIMSAPTQHNSQQSGLAIFTHASW